MFKRGDIIFVDGYVGDDGISVGYHPFLVVSDKKGVVEGLCFDTVGTVMSSFDGKSEEYKTKKLSYEENMSIEASQTSIVDGDARDGYTKADQLYYFEKSEIKYRYFGRADDEVIKRLLNLINYLDSKNKVKVNTHNLCNKANLETEEKKLEEIK